MDSGIFFYKSPKTVVTENNFESNSVCVEARDSPETQISSNSMTRGTSGISLVGSSESSIVSGNSIVVNTGSGMFLSGASNSTIKHNNVSGNNETGIIFYSSYNNTVVANTITGNGQDGVGLWEEGTGNTISDNLIANNSRCGFLIRYCCNNTIFGNMITKNSNSAIRFVGEASNNLIYHNNFIENNNNGAQISFSTTFGNSAAPNMWDNGVEGNYWSESKSTPYFISENNQDNHPLPSPIDFVSPEIPSIILAEGTKPASGFPEWAIAIIIAVATTSFCLGVYLKKRKR
jgi:parallel beta-helix repeat protein